MVEEKEKGQVVINTSVSWKCWGQEWQAGSFSLSSRAWQVGCLQQHPRGCAQDRRLLCDLSTSLRLEQAAENRVSCAGLRCFVPISPERRVCRGVYVLVCAMSECEDVCEYVRVCPPLCDSHPCPLCSSCGEPGASDLTFRLANGVPSPR